MMPREFAKAVMERLSEDDALDLCLDLLEIKRVPFQRLEERRAAREKEDAAK